MLSFTFSHCDIGDRTQLGLTFEGLIVCVWSFDGLTFEGLIVCVWSFDFLKKILNHIMSDLYMLHSLLEI